MDLSELLSAPNPTPARTKTGTAATGRALAERWARDNRWIPDSYGNYKKPGRPYIRLKFARAVIRMEVRLEVRLADGTWRRLRSAYYKALFLNARGDLCGMKR